MYAPACMGWMEVWMNVSVYGRMHECVIMYAGPQTGRQARRQAALFMSASTVRQAR